MQNTSNIKLDELIRQIHVINPDLPCDDQADRELLRKLNEQIVKGTPIIALQKINLKRLIMNVKKSLSDLKKNIDDSVAQQQLRRTTRVRKTIAQDPKVFNFFNPGKCVKAVSTPSCSSNTTSNPDVTDLEGLVQVERLPVTASTNLITIFIPSVLQEQMHSSKYQISIDLNCLGITRKIVVLNQEKRAKTTVDNECKAAVKYIENEIANKNDQDYKITYEKREGQTIIRTPIQSNTDKIELKLFPNTIESSVTLEPDVSIVTDAVEPSASTKLPIKRKLTKAPPICTPKKRGRKLGSKNKKKVEKSELAKYVETFACNTGSPSAVSQIVTSTTQNWDIPSEHGGPIAYFMSGEWTLNVPSNSGNQLVSTTNEAVNMDESSTNGQDTFIPFEDFVNFIENPSMDVGNVIARVLDGSDPSTTCTLNNQESEGTSMCAEISQATKSNENTNSRQQTQLLPKPIDGSNLNIVHSTVVNSKENTTDEALNLSKEYDVSYNVNVLDLTQKKPTATPSYQEVVSVSPCRQQTGTENKNVIFSTTRSMPLLDDLDDDLFPHPVTPVRNETETVQKTEVVFSTTSNTSPTNSHKSYLGAGSMTDSAIEIDKREMVDYYKGHTKTETLKEMSLLEIEKDIDDSMLDFDNCLDDDLLSLAPSSCFNSPNDDRFDSDFLDNSNVKTTTIFESSTPAPRSQLELSFPKPKNDEFNRVLNKFKIPRVQQKTEPEPSKEVTPAKAPIENENIIQVIKYLPNSNASTVYPGGGPSHNIPDLIILDSNATSSPKNEGLEISNIFGNPCYDFLAEECYHPTCESRHQQLEPSSIVSSLLSLQDATLNLAYNFIWRHIKLFKFYFPTFCNEYARRNMRKKLSNMIADCALQPDSLPFLKNIHSALLSGGFNSVNACRFILKHFKERTPLAINIMVEIIIDSDAAMFVQSLDEFSQVAGYTFRMKDINQMATAYFRSNCTDLVAVIIKCLIKVDREEYLTTQSPDLKNLVDMIKDNIV